MATRTYIVLDAFIVGAFDICLSVLCFVRDKLINVSLAKWKNIAGFIRQ